MKKTSSLFLILALVSLGACGGRVPEPQTAQKVFAKHFKKYGKKYPTTDFGERRIAKVEIGNIIELQKKFVAVEGLVYLEGNESPHPVLMTLERKPFRWKVVSWEKFGQEKAEREVENRPSKK